MRKIRYLKNEEINKKKWDACITHAFNGNTYAYSWYLDIIHPNWSALVEEEYVRVMPLPVKQKYGVTYCYQPYFAQQLGVFSVSVLTPDIVTGFISKIPDFIKVIDMNLNSFSNPDSKKYTVDLSNNYMLDLIQEYPRLSAKYRSNTKRNLKTAEKSKLTLMKGVGHEEIITLFRNHRGRGMTKWRDEHYQTLSRLMYTAIYQGQGVTYGVYSERNELISGAFFLNNKQKLVFLFSGTNAEGRSSSALTFLIDSVIKEYSPGKMILDFEGSNNVNLARFYAGFDAKLTHYYRLKLNRLSPVGNLLFKVAAMLK
ncbi:MAG: hypothetical protein KKB74_10605 [Bacteroidetes bacterium]|nr:hypothetical protein [Bacteroidota bacterium]